MVIGGTGPLIVLFFTVALPPSPTTMPFWAMSSMGPPPVMTFFSIVAEAGPWTSIPFFWKLETWLPLILPLAPLM